ncbi:hypothetical protein Ahy_B06g080626 [Arachis hypogaea]|uniref:Uncharacterized protein n=1 Tax=Arachis hypogaea TaxID=3818 RepID=A0A444YIH6_ARAHY|nr:hypothetical protein Ahy_B06g080626 [Arachis hypogaea]
MQEAHRASVEVPAASLNVITSQSMLVPPVLDGRHVSREHQKERRQRPELVDPCALLNLHPPLYPLCVPFPPPPHQIHHHHPRVEVAGPTPLKCPGEAVVRPERRREILAEVGVAVFGCSDGPGAQAGAPELGYVDDDNQIGIEVDDSVDASFEKVSEVANDIGIEVVYLEVQLREGGLNEGIEIGVGDKEMEEDVLRAERVLEDGVDGGDGAAEVLEVEG